MSLAQRLRDFLPTVYKRYGPLVARQYAYRAETAGLVVKSKATFNYVNKILTELRKKGKLPWSAVLDASREFDPWVVSTSEDTDLYIRISMRDFKTFPDKFDLPRWQYQSIIPVIVTEKEGLIQYFEAATMKRSVTIYASRGQAGLSHLHEEVLPWLVNQMAENRKIRLLYLGDCDDEGFQIPVTLLQNLSEWLDGGIQFDQQDLYPRTFPRVYHEGSLLTFERLALKPDQVEEMGLRKDPINPNSSIARKFVDYKCELEAIEPDELRRIISEAIDESWDEDAEKKRNDKVEEMRKPIKERIDELTKNWPEIE